ncbi:MAG: ATP-binding domain-containing protein, partial [Victivallales bacterium]|nr:ATP-binding domain-containing protein [Victivallales bacterium]
AKNAVRFPKELEAQSQPGPKPKYYHAKSVQDEAQWIVRTIQQLSSSEFEAHPYRLSQIAILYRAHYLSRVIEEQLIQAKIPYKLYSGIEFYCRAEIKDVLCYLRMVTAGDNLAFLRTIDNPSRRIGKKKLAHLEELARQKACTLFEALQGDLGNPIWRNTGAADYVGAIQRIRALRELRTVPPIDQLLQRILDLSGYEAALRLESNQSRLDNLAELKRAVAEFAHADADATLEDFLNQVALLTNLDHSAARDTVKLMTVHTAKGLEFPCVFVAGLNEGVFPSRKVVTPDEMDEERRIAYVAFTRAKERLFLSDAEGVDNDNVCKFPSRFIFDAGKENLDCVQPIPDELLRRAKAYIQTDETRLKAISELFTPGQKVIHQVFGTGTILQVNLRDACYEIQFEKLSTPRTLRFGTPLTLAD